MEFFNRIGDFAKNVGDRTNDMLEIGKLNSRIHGEEDAIEQHFYDLGEYIWEKFESGVAMDERATVICMAIRERKGNIRSMEEEIQQIRLAQEENRQAGPKPAGGKRAGPAGKIRPGNRNLPHLRRDHRGRLQILWRLRQSDPLIALVASSVWKKAALRRFFSSFPFSCAACTACCRFFIKQTNFFASC